MSISKLYRELTRQAYQQSEDRIGHNKNNLYPKHRSIFPEDYETQFLAISQDELKSKVFQTQNQLEKYKGEWNELQKKLSVMETIQKQLIDKCRTLDSEK